MTINLIFKIAAVGILVSILCQVLKHSGREEQAFLTSLAGLLLVLQFKSGKSEYGIYISIALGMLIFASLLGKISLLKDVLNEVSNVVGLNSDYFKTLWKILGVTYAAEFSSAICKDAGYQTIALQIEVFAKITILVLSLPVLSALLQTIRGFLV